MIHPPHLIPPSRMDSNKLAWLAYWQEERSELVNQRNTYIYLLGLSGLAFAIHFGVGPQWSILICGCVSLIFAGLFYYHRKKDNIVEDWDRIGQLPYVDQCREVRDQLQAKGKPGWFHLWYLIGVPVFWVVYNMDSLDWGWTGEMTNSLLTGLVFGIVVNLFHQGRKRKQWQEGTDLADKALSE